MVKLIVGMSQVAIRLFIDDRDFKHKRLRNIQKLTQLVCMVIEPPVCRYICLIQMT